MTAGRPASTVVKHSLVIAGHRTSVSLEQAFWTALKRLAAARGLSVSALVAEIDRDRGASNLSSAIRVHVLEHAAAAAERAPHEAAE
jgi:predicted DNA-binding ribbon-helix-helix protein